MLFDEISSNKNVMLFNEISQLRRIKIKTLKDCNRESTK